MQRHAPPRRWWALALGAAALTCLLLPAPATAQPPAASVAADSVALTPDGWTAEGQVRLKTDDTEIVAERASLRGAVLELRHAYIVHEGHPYRVDVAIIHLETGEIRGERLATKDARGNPVAAGEFTLRSDGLSLRSAVLTPTLRAGAAERIEGQWSLTDGALLSGGVPIAPFDRVVGDHRRTSGVLPPWVGYLGEGDLEAGGGLFAPLGPSADAAVGIYGDHSGGAGVEGRFRHVGGDLRLAGTLLDAGSSSQELAIVGAGAIDPREFPSLRYDLDWLSHRSLAGRLRLHPWQAGRLDRRLGAPGRSSIATGVRTWNAGFDVTGALWQPPPRSEPGPSAAQASEVSTAMGMTFDVLDRAQVELQLAAARLPADRTSNASLDVATVEVHSSLPLQVGRFARVRAHAQANTSTASYDHELPDGREELAGRHTFTTGLSLRVDSVVRRPGAHDLELGMAAYLRPSDVAQGSAEAPAPDLPYRRVLVRRAVAARVGQRFPAANLRIDLGIAYAQLPKMDVSSRAGVRARWRSLFVEGSTSGAERRSEGFGAGTRLSWGRGRATLAARRVPADVVWSQHPADPLAPSLAAAQPLRRGATGLAASFDTPMWPGAPLHLGADVFAPLSGSGRDPEIGGFVALGNRDAMRLEIRAIRRRDPKTFDALATASFMGF